MKQEPKYPPGTLSTFEVAKILKVSVGTVHNMTRQGALHPTRIPSPKGTGKKVPRYFLPDVIAASEARTKEYDLPTVASFALRALAYAEAAQRDLAQLKSLLGLDHTVLATDEESCIELYLKTQERLRTMDVLPPVKEVFFWAKTFMAITESYLRVAEEHTADPNGWKLFYDLAQRMSESAPRAQFEMNKNLESAYGFLEAGRRNLRTASYFFVRTRRGEAAAVRLFPDGRINLDDGVMALLFPN